MVRAWSAAAVVFLAVVAVVPCPGLAGPAVPLAELVAGATMGWDLTRAECSAGFVMVIDGRREHHLVVRVDGGWARVEGTFRSGRGEVPRQVAYRTQVSAKHGRVHERFDLPLDAGRYEMKVTWGATTAKGPEEGSRVEVDLVAGAEVEVPGPGSVGTLRVRGMPAGAVTARAQYGATYDGRSEGTADRLPNGDALLWLPAGMWTVRGAAAREVSACRYADCHMVPVFEGRETTLDWPAAMLAAEGTERSLGRLQVLTAAASGDEAWVDVALLERETKVHPTTDAVGVWEAGLPGSVRSVEVLTEPLSVVLLLDSSGSMKGSMAAALSATKGFVKGLPAGTKIRVVDFDTDLKLLPGTTAADALKGLSGVVARGATALYDAVMEGLRLLRGEGGRRALLVFTDGVDANWNDTAPGSRATKDQVLGAVKAGGVPVFSIAFGASPDRDTLTRVAKASGGAYFEASDEASLSSVFAGITKDWGRQFRVRYGRPRAPAAGDAPVVALMIDNSGSMDLDPTIKGCGYRIEAVRQLFRRFVDALPAEVVVQLMTFSTDARVDQVFTTDRLRLRRALASMQGKGGTNIIDALRTSSRTLAAVPSTRRYLCFFSDAALEVEKKDQADFEALLGGLKDDAVTSLFVGMVPSAEAAPFARAAALAGGTHVVAEDVESIDATVREFLARVAAPAAVEAGLPLRVRLREGTRFLGAATRVGFTPLTDEGRRLSVEEVRHEVGGPVRPYDGELARVVSGSSLPDREVAVTSRLTVGETRRNEAAELTVHEATFLGRLRGVDAPRGKRLLALTTSWRNVMPVQRVAVYGDGASHPVARVIGAAPPLRTEERTPTYLVPDLRRHLWLRWNRDHLLPISDATWLAEAPLMLPGERALGIEAGSPTTGAAVFLVPDEQMEQASLELFDTSYGHVQVPVAGDPTGTPFEAVRDLPTRAPSRLGDAFALTLTGYRDLERVEGTAMTAGTTLRVLQARFASRVQALLNIAPSERFSLLLPTSRGELRLPLHPLTAALPGGLYSSTLLAPGDRNEASLAFQVPTGTTGALLHADVRGGAALLPLDEVPAPAVTLPKAAFTGQGLSVVVHRVAPLAQLPGVGRNYVAVEHTVVDEGDGNHVRFGDLLALEGTGAAAGVGAAAARAGLGNLGGGAVADGRIRPSASTGKLLFGVDGRTVLLGRRARRGVTLFDVPPRTVATSLRLVSPLLGGAPVAVEGADYADPLMLLVKAEEEKKEANLTPFGAKVAELGTALARQRRAEGRERPGRVTARSMVPESGDPEREALPPPPSTLAGAEALAELVAQRGGATTTSGVDVTGLAETLAGLRLMGSRRARWRCLYGPEAVLTQGWGSLDDLAGLARGVLTRRGYRTVAGTVAAGPGAEAALARWAGDPPRGEKTLPVLMVREGTRTLARLVLPFMREVDEAGDLVSGAVTELDDVTLPLLAQIRVRVEVSERTGSAAGATRSAASALSGSAAAATRFHSLLTTTLPMDALGTGLCDIFYTETPTNEGMRLFAILSTPAGVQVGAEPLDLALWKVAGEEISVGGANLPGTVWARPVAEGESLTNRYRAFVVAAPDLPAAAVAALDERRAALRAGAGDEAPDLLSSLRWYAGGVLDRFVGAQTKQEEGLAAACGVVANRADAPRALMLLMGRETAAGETAASLDLTRVKADVTRGDAEGQTAFRQLSGLFEAGLEAWALPGGVGIFDLWARCPAGTELWALAGTDRRDAIKGMREAGWPADVVARLERGKPLIVVPSSPAMIDGRPRWAWLEIDPRTGETLSMFDDGTHGAMAEGFLMDMAGNLNQCMVGFLKGIENAIWARCAFTLELSDAKAVDIAAKKFCLGVAENFSVGATGKVDGTDWGIGVATGAMPSADVGLVGLTVNENFKPKLNQNIVNFASGYKAAVNLYFRNR